PGDRRVAAHGIQSPADPPAPLHRAPLRSSRRRGTARIRTARCTHAHAAYLRSARRSRAVARAGSAGPALHPSRSCGAPGRKPPCSAPSVPMTAPPAGQHGATLIGMILLALACLVPAVEGCVIENHSTPPDRPVTIPTCPKASDVATLVTVD